MNGETEIVKFLKRTIIVLGLSVVLVFISFIPTSAQFNDTKFEQIQIGVSNCFLQDSNGFLWVGSQEGLARYDGHNLKFYSNVPFDSTSLSNNWVTVIVEDKNGNLWVGTRGGLNYFDQRTEKFRRYFYVSSLEGNLELNGISCIILNKDETMWIGSEHGLCHLSFDKNGKAFCKKYKFNKSNSNDKWGGNAVWSLLKDDDGKLWIGTGGSGLIYFDPETENYKQFQYDPKKPEGIKSNLVSSICQDDSGNIWFATFFAIYDIPGTGLGTFNPKTETFSYFNYNAEDSSSLSTDNIHCLFIDRSNTLWMGCYDKGICSIPLKIIYNGSRIDFTKYKNLRSSIINNIYEDKNGIIWIGLLDIAFAKYSREKNPFRRYYRNHSSPNSLSSSGINCLFIDHLDNIWFGHYLSGVTEYNPKTMTYTHFKHNAQDKNGLSANLLYAICEDNDGKIWFGTMGGGIDIYDPQNKNFEHIKADSKNNNGLKLNNIRFLLKSHTGDIWISPYTEGLQQYKIKTNEIISFDIDSNSIKDEDISILYEDDQGFLWVGTFDDGLYRLNIENNRIIGVKHFIYDPNKKNSLSNNDVTDIIQTKSINKNYLWIATAVGLNKFDIHTESFKHFFKKDGLPSDFILQLLEDKKGNIWITTPYNLSVYDINTLKFNTFSQEDGLPVTGFGGGRRVSAVSKSGELLFGSSTGALAFFPEDVLAKQNLTKLVFTDFKVFNESIELDTAINYIKRIELGHDQNAVSFEFTDLNFSQTNKNQFTYKLEGLYEKWINIGDERKVSFTNLSPGNYKLKVKIADQLQNAPETSVILTILPPWWKTWWAYSIAIILIFSLVYTIYKYRLNKLLAIERMRVQIATDLHDDVGASLTKIAVHSEIIQSTEDRKKITSSSAKIGNMSREIITSLSDIIWSIDARNDTVGDLIDRMRDYLETVFPTGNMITDFQTEGLEFGNNISQSLRQNIYLIFKEAVNNAAKHSGATEVNIYMTNGNGKFKLEINDNGKGIEMNERNSGYHGLQNMKMRAERIGGEMTIENKNGTRITLIVKEL